MKSRFMFIRKLWSVSVSALKCLVRWGCVVMLIMSWGMGGVWAACSSYVGTVVFNEVQLANGSGAPAYLELRILNPNVMSATNYFSGWTLSVNTKIPASTGTVVPLPVNLNAIVTDTSKNTCGPNSAWIQIPDASIGGAIAAVRDNKDDLNFVLYDDKGDMVDLLRISDSTSMPSFYSGAGTQCASIEPSPASTFNAKYDFVWGAGSSIKDWYRTTDGTGTWTGRNTANNANSICGSNDVNQPAQIGLNKVVSTTTVNTDTEFSFQLFAQNPSTGVSQSNVLVSDDLNNAGLSFVSCTATASDTCTNSSGVVTWTIESLPVSSIRSALLTVKASTAGSKTNVIKANTSGTPTASASVSVTNSAPAITTVAASGLTSTSAVLNGTVNPNGVSTTVGFGYGLSSGIYTTTCTPSGNPFDGNAVQSFSCSLSSLTCGKTYYYRATGTNSAGTSNGNEMSFVPPCPAVSGFNAFESITAANASVGKIYTKLAGTSFSLDVVAINGAVQETTFNNNVKLELLANTGTAGSGYGGDNCPTSNQVVQTIAAAAIASGRSTVAFSAVPSAYRDVRVRVTYSGVTPAIVACSSDSFAIRPRLFTVTSPMNNAILTGTPKAVAGDVFDLTADTGVTSGYVGTPVLDVGKIVDHAGAVIAAGALTGGFAAADGVKAVGDAFKYFDVGNIQLQADAVVDSNFTSVDQSADCISGSSSNTLSGGKYGCNVGSNASAMLGRWYPSHFSLTNVFTPACVAGGFTYMGDDHLGVSLALKAHAKGTGLASASDPVASRYLFLDADGNGVQDDAMPLALVTITAENNGTAVLVSKLKTPDFPAMPSKSLWAAGVFSISDTYSFERPTTPAVGTDFYGAFKFKAAVSDPVDGVTLLAPDTTSATKILYGRLRLSNVFGSKQGMLEMPLEAQYWTGNSWLLNSSDSCTSIPDNTPKSVYLFGSSLATTANAAITLAGGKGVVQLTPTGLGSVDVALNLSNCSNTPAVGGTALGMPWLSAGSDGKTCPKAKATFGIYEAEKKKAVHVRELF